MRAQRQEGNTDLWDEGDYSRAERGGVLGYALSGYEVFCISVLPGRFLAFRHWASKEDIDCNERGVGQTACTFTSRVRECIDYDNKLSSTMTVNGNQAALSFICYIILR